MVEPESEGTSAAAKPGPFSFWGKWTLTHSPEHKCSQVTFCYVSDITQELSFTVLFQVLSLVPYPFHLMVNQEHFSYFWIVFITVQCLKSSFSRLIVLWPAGRPDPICTTFPSGGRVCWSGLQVPASPSLKGKHTSWFAFLWKIRLPSHRSALFSLSTRDEIIRKSSLSCHTTAKHHPQ